MKRIFFVSLKDRNDSTYFIFTHGLTYTNLRFSLTLFDTVDKGQKESSGLSTSTHSQDAYLHSVEQINIVL